eukprot:1064420_1
MVQHNTLTFPPTILDVQQILDDYIAMADNTNPPTIDLTFKDIFWMYSWISFCLNNELPCLMLISVSRNVFDRKSKKQKINKLGLKPRCFPRKVLSGWLENQERLNEQNTRVLKALRWKFDTKKYLTERNVYPSDLL